MNFNPKLPYNQLPLLPPDYDFDNIDILKKVNTANIALSKLSGEAKSIPKRELLIVPLTYREAVASSEIENINTTIDEALQTTYISEPDLKKEQKEIKNYREALFKGYEIIKDKGFLSTNSFIEIQKVLEPSKSGIRKIPGTKIQNQATQEIIYTPPEGETVIRNLLKNFEDYFNDQNSDIDPLIKMAVLHYQFESIHPFLDGNGRTGRILMVLYLCLMQRLELPILFISGYINRNKNNYYKLLKDITINNNWKEWVMYILTAVEEQSIETTKSVQGIRDLMFQFRDLIHKKNSKLPHLDLAEYLVSYPYYSQKSIMAKLDLNARNTALKYFNELKEIGIITETKYKNDKIYSCLKFLELLK